MKGTAALGLGFTLLAAGAADAAGDCRIRRAEATICPDYQLFEAPDHVEAISGDGRTLVGFVQVEGTASVPFRSVPMRWVDGRPRPLPGLPEDLFDGRAQAVSEDGSVIAGALILEGGTQYDVFRWVDGVTEIYDGGGGFPWVPTGLSADGSVMIAAKDSLGARWTEETGSFERWQVPPDPGGGYPRSPLDLSPTGVDAEAGVIVGHSHDPDHVTAWSWVGDVSTRLPVTPGFIGESTANGISPDGEVVVGSVSRCAGNSCVSLLDGAVWRDGEFERYPLPLRRVSWEGAFFVGSAYPHGQGETAKLVRAATGEIRDIEAILEQLGVRVPVAPALPRGLSYDGHVVTGLVPAPDTATFRAVISPKLGIDIEPWRRSNRIDLSSGRPVVVRIYGSGQADASQIDPGELRFGPDRAHAVDAGPARDFNRDGFADRDFVFDPVEAGLAVGDREACLAGVAAELPFRLCSRVQTTWGHRHWPFQPPPG